MGTIVVMTGGGIKGAVAAARSAVGNELTLVHVDYGQPSAAAELKATRALAKTFSHCRMVPLILSHASQVQQGWVDPPGSSPPDRHTGDKDSLATSAAWLRGLMPVLMSLGVQWALRVGASAVVTGLTRLGDGTHLGLTPAEGAAYGRGEFVHSVNVMIASLLPQSSKLKVEAPLMDLGYPQMLSLAQRFGVPLELTWTCARSGPVACGRCEQCRARAGAFTEALLVDPLTNTPTASATSPTTQPYQAHLA